MAVEKRKRAAEPASSSSSDKSSKKPKSSYSTSSSSSKPKASFAEASSKKSSGKASASTLATGAKHTTTTPSKDISAPAAEFKTSLRNNNEETAFPRGGASVLTPLEHKQIQIQAEKDVLFGEDGGAKAYNGDNNDDEDGMDLDGSGAEDGGASSLSKKSKLRAKSKVKTKGKGGKDGMLKDDEPQLRIEGLGYKRLFPGSIVLGQVTNINASDITVALPNNLVGYVLFVSVSEKITSTIEEALDKEDESDDGDENEDKDGTAFDMHRAIAVGQYLRAYVVSTTEKSQDKKDKRRLELSLLPRLANTGLKDTDVVPNSMIQAAVASVEDHGVIMKLDLAGSSVTGFIALEDLPSRWRSQPNEVPEGAVLLCQVKGKDARTVKLTANEADFAKGRYVKDTPTINGFLPGTVFEGLIFDVTTTGIAVRIMGSIDATVDVVHLGTGPEVDLAKKFKIGKNIKGRLTCTFPSDDTRMLGFSLLEHVMSLSSETAGKKAPLATSSKVEDAKVTQIVKDGVGSGLYVNVAGHRGFVHVSRLSDEKSEVTSPKFRVGSVHPVRVLGYNSMDRLYILSMQPSVLAQRYLILEDVVVGDIVKGKIERLLVGGSGVTGAIFQVSDGITGLVTAMHLSDVKLVHPERKFHEGSSVTARVLSVDLSRRQLRLTFKKTLTNSDKPIIDKWDAVSPGQQSPGTIVKLLPAGALVEFYGGLRGFLPVAEMSEAHITDPSEHFREGQVVNVRILSVSPSEHKMQLSCKMPVELDESQEASFNRIMPGDIVTGTVLSKAKDEAQIQIQPAGIKAVLLAGHLTDNSEKRNLATLGKLKTGQTLDDLVVLEKMVAQSVLVLSSKPSLVEAGKNKTLPTRYEDVARGRAVKGYVKNITPSGVFVGFANGLTGLILKGGLPVEIRNEPNFGMHRLQSVSATVLSTDDQTRRFLLTMQEVPAAAAESLEGAFDPNLRSLDDLKTGFITKARISSVKTTQLNVTLADGIQGRIDVSQVYDSISDIADPKWPLKPFQQKQIIDVRVMGLHDTRNHKFLPLSHRSTKNSVFELSAKPSILKQQTASMLRIEDLSIGQDMLAFVNKVSDDGLWVNLSPNVRGRIKALDASDDVKSLQEMDFPLGSAIQARVTHVDVAQNRIDLSARQSSSSAKPGSTVPGRVTKIQDLSLLVQVAEKAWGRVHPTDISDDYDTVQFATYQKNDIHTVHILSEDGNSLTLSMRPSLVSKSKNIKDRRIASAASLSVNDIVRGFVQNITDKGLFVALGPNVTAYIRISDLSDAFIKDWKATFSVGQLVRGKIVAVDTTLNHIQMSLKQSIIDSEYVAPLSFSDLKEGTIITGKIRKVEDFGAFIVIDNSNISGLCHRSEMADGPVDVKKVYKEGDPVKAKILKIDVPKRRINFGMKMAYLLEDAEGGSESDAESLDEDMAGVALDSESSGDEDMQDADDRDVIDDDEEDEDSGDENVGADSALATSSLPTLKTKPFDWTASAFSREGSPEAGTEGVSLTASADSKKPRRKRAEIKQDNTSLDSSSPTTPSDFERLLLSSPDNAVLWVQYMAHHLSLSNLAAARSVADRAIAAMPATAEAARLDLETAILNMEASFGSPASLASAYESAKLRNDKKTLAERYISILISSRQNELAEEQLQKLAKKFSFDPAVWINYAAFLFGPAGRKPEEARKLLPRAQQALDKKHELTITAKFAALEFKEAGGGGDIERGRTLFEGMLGLFEGKSSKKWMEAWNFWIAAELGQWKRLADGSDDGDGRSKQRRWGRDNNNEQEKDKEEEKTTQKQNIRDLFKRAIKLVGGEEGKKKKRVESILKMWRAWESGVDDGAGLSALAEWEV